MPVLRYTVRTCVEETMRLTGSKLRQVGLAVCLLSACGGTGGSPAVVATPTPSLPDLHGRIVRVAVEASAPPFDYVDAGGQGFGWDYDTVREICRRLNCIAQFQQTAFQGVFDAVHAGQFDMLAAGVTITAAREQLVVFSVPYATVSEVVLVRADELESLAQFEIDPTKIVGAQAGSTTAQTALDTFGAPRVRTLPTEPQVVNAVLMGTFDGAVLDSVAANAFIFANPTLLKRLGALTSGEQLAFAFPLNSTLVAPVNAALQSMMSDGTLTALNIKWRVAS
jgi:ABC-type amino acid transport substrate-binding protein